MFNTLMDVLATGRDIDDARASLGSGVGEDNCVLKKRKGTTPSQGRIKSVSRDVCLGAVAVVAAFAVDVVVSTFICNAILRDVTSPLAPAQSAQTPPTDQCAVGGAAAVAEEVTSAVRGVMISLQQTPLGIKLNPPLTRSLTSAAVYLIDVWASFMRACLQPLCGVSHTLWHIILSVLLAPGVLVLAAAAQDALILLTVHAQCLCAYSHTLHRLHLGVLGSTFRLFRGKKANPLRNRVDSHEYEVAELLFGTLVLSVGAFLYPTVLAIHLALQATWLGVVAVIATVGFVAAVYHATVAGFCAVIFEVLWLGRPCHEPHVMYTLATTAETTARVTMVQSASADLVLGARPLAQTWAVGWNAVDWQSFMPSAKLAYEPIKTR